MSETDPPRIRVYLNDPAGRGERLVSVEPPRDTEKGPWAFRVTGRAPAPRAYAIDTPEFLYWQLTASLDRGRRFWSRHRPLPGGWIPGPVLPAVPAAGRDLNAYYDREALRFFRDRDEKTGELVQSGDSPDVVTHEQGHAVLDALRPDLWDAPHFEVSAFHEAFGDLAAISIALAEPALAASVDDETGGDAARSNLVSRFAEELGRAVRDRYGPEAASAGALRDAVNAFRYVDPATLPDDAPDSRLSAEPHSFCRVMTGACWDALVALFLARDGPDRAAALTAAAEDLCGLVLAAVETAPSGADFFGRVARRIVREAAAGLRAPVAPQLARAFYDRKLTASPEVPPELAPDEDSDVPAPRPNEPPPEPLVRAIQARLGPELPGDVVSLALPSADSPTARLLRGRRRRDLFLHGPEYGPADGAAVEIADAFALGFGDEGFLRASRVHRAGTRDEEDARAFVRHLARRRRIGDCVDAEPDARALVREGQTHAVVCGPDGIRRVRRIWIARRKETP
jgi:hypothetical protein